MQQRILGRLVFAATYSVWGAVATSSLAAPIEIRIDATQQAQDFEGWGTSLGWWANRTGRWSDEKIEALLGQIGDPDSGLGYNLFRYNIGGGDQPGHNHMAPFRDIQGFKPTETGPYDWSADPYQRKILTRLSQRYEGAIFDAYANSPPWWMTESQCSGGNPGGSDNLAPENYEKFADYLATVVQHFHWTWGVTFANLSPFNEPSARWWTGPNKNQEGCGFRNGQATFINLLGSIMLNREVVHTQIAAPEENGIDVALARLGEYDDTALAYLGRIHAHSYEGKSKRRDFADFVDSHYMRSWQSESGPLNWSGGGQMEVSLYMADVIIRDLKEMRVNGWLDWQVIDTGVWGSLHADDSLQVAIPQKRASMHRQFSRFIRPGSIILQCETENALAALVPSTGQVVLVVLNADSGDHEYRVDFSGFSSLGAIAAVYRTSASEDMAKLPDISLSKSQFSFTAKTRSITTLVCKGLAATQVQIVLPRMMSRMMPRNGQSHFSREWGFSGNAFLPGLTPKGYDAMGRWLVPRR